MTENKQSSRSFVPSFSQKITLNSPIWSRRLFKSPTPITTARCRPQIFASLRALNLLSYPRNVKNIFFTRLRQHDTEFKHHDLNVIFWKSKRRRLFATLFQCVDLKFSGLELFIYFYEKKSRLGVFIIFYYSMTFDTNLLVKYYFLLLRKNWVWTFLLYHYSMAFDINLLSLNLFFTFTKKSRLGVGVFIFLLYHYIVTRDSKVLDSGLFFFFYEKT